MAAALRATRAGHYSGPREGWQIGCVMSLVAVGRARDSIAWSRGCTEVCSKDMVWLADLGQLGFIEVSEGVSAHRGATDWG